MGLEYTYVRTYVYINFVWNHWKDTSSTLHMYMVVAQNTIFGFLLERQRYYRTDHNIITNIPILKRKLK